METKKQPKVWGFWRIVATVFVYLAVVLVVIGVVGAFTASLIYDHITEEREGGPARSILIPEGLNTRDIGAILAREGFIEHENFFRIALRFEGGQGVVRHGYYDLPEGLSAGQYLALLYKGPTRHDLSNQIRVTIPEGLSITQIAGLLDDGDAFLEVVEDPAWRDRLGLTAETLEGYLMPDTYFFNTEPTAEDLVERMVSQFERVYNRIATRYPGAEEFDRHTIMTVASLVEREARIEAERPLVAAVVYNRLEENMPLQFDSTLQYALNKYGQRMLDADKEVDSPYNTYRFRGLPPGPIASPGEASIRAAIAPAQEPYLYFVSNADGESHTFSRTYREHQEAVARYRREIAQQRRELEERQAGQGAQ